MDDSKLIDSINSTKYYGNYKYIPQSYYSKHSTQKGKKNTHPKRTISAPKIPKNKKTFSNRLVSGLIAGTIALGGITATTIAVINEVQETIQENQEISEAAETFKNVIEGIHENSEFLQVSLRKSDYSNYVKHIIEIRLKEEPYLMDLIENKNINQEALLYLITGEKSQETTFTEQDISNILTQCPTNEKISFNKKGNPNKLIACLAQIGTSCEGQNMERFYKELLPSILGNSSISCGPEATLYRQNQILDILTSLKKEAFYIPQLQGNIAMNKDPNQKLIKAYAEKLYNPLIESANNIQSKQSFQNVIDPNYLENITNDLSKYPIVPESYNINTFNINAKVASEEDFYIFREIRSNYYTDCIEFAKDPDTATITLNSEFSETSNYLNNLNSTTSHTLKDFYSLITSHEKNIESVKGSNTHTSTIDFSH